MMPDAETGPPLLTEVSSHLRRPLLACAFGRLPPNVALMHLLAAGAREEDVEHALALMAAAFPVGSGVCAERCAAFQELWRSNPEAVTTVRAVLASLDEPASKDHRGPQQWAALFDRIAAVSPEAGVALYSLGRADLLEAATASLVARLREWGLARPDTRVLDLGCGMGRLAAALAPGVVSVVGTDVSRAMLDVAKARCAGRANVSFHLTSGRDLGHLPPAGFDLVLAIDVFPYLVAAEDGLAARHVQEIARVLVPGGSALLANYSYRGEPDRDLAEVEHYAHCAALTLVRCATGDFDHWDGRTYLLRRASEPG